MNENENISIQDEAQGAEDSLLEEIVEEPQDDSISLEDALSDGAAEQQEQPEQPQSAGGQKEPGYVKRRISEATQPLYAEIEALKAQLEPLRQYQMDVEAQELVRSGKVKDLDTARELVRYRQGQPQTAPAESQPRNEKGQFTAQQDNQVSPATQKQIDMLRHQADRIKADGGPDVIAEFRDNEEIRNKVMTGEMDFYDVARQMQKPGRKPPSPMRSPNGASGASHSFDFANMTSEQFAKLEKRIQEGARISLRQ